MAHPVKHDFKPSALAMIRGRLWNKIARICSYWASGKHIDVIKPETPSPNSPIVFNFNAKTAAPEIAHEFHAQKLWSGDTDVAENETDIPADATDTEKTALLNEFAKNAPKEDKPVSSSETTDDKIKRIGVSERAARADHVHPALVSTLLEAFEMPTTYGNTQSGHANNALLTTEWERGQTDSNGKPVGVKIYLPTDSWDTGVRSMLAWRLCEFDSLGRLQKVYKQTIATESVSYQQLQ